MGKEYKSPLIKTVCKKAFTCRDCPAKISAGDLMYFDNRRTIIGRICLSCGDKLQTGDSYPELGEILAALKGIAGSLEKLTAGQADTNQRLLEVARLLSEKPGVMNFDPQKAGAPAPLGDGIPPVLAEIRARIRPHLEGIEQ